MKTFNEIGLPTIEEVYAPKKNDYNLLKTVTFIKTDLEREIGIGEDYPYGPLPFGECHIDHGWIMDTEIVIYRFRFDYIYLAKQFNNLAEQNGWEKLKDVDKLG